MVEVKKVDFVKTIETVPPNLREAAMSHCIAIQLSQGCSRACGQNKYCGFSAIFGVGEQFDLGSVVKGVKCYRQVMKELSMLYFASDTEDYYDYPKLLKKISPNLLSPEMLYTSTALPFGKEDQLWETLKVAMKYHQTVRISFNPKNVDRVKEFLCKNYGPQWAEKKPYNLDLYKMDNRFKLRAGSAKEQPLLDHDSITAFDLVANIAGIGCQDGVVITPSGVEATMVVGTTSKYPEGLIRWPVKDKAVLPKVQSMFYLNGDPAKRLKREELRNLNGAIPDIVLTDESGKLVETPLVLAARRDLLFLAYFLYRVADDGIWYRDRDSLKNVAYKDYQFRLDRAKRGAEESGDQELKSLVAFIDRAMSDLWPQALEGRRIRLFSEEDYGLNLLKMVRQDENSLLSFDDPFPNSTDLTKYKN